MLIVGIKANEERLYFEYWVYQAWLHGCLEDPFLIDILSSIKEWRPFR